MSINNFEFKGFTSEEQQIEALCEMLQSGDDFSSGEYIVCTEEGKTEALEEYIKESLWAFRTEFLINHISDKKELFDELASVFPIYEYVNPEYLNSNDDEDEWEIDYDSIDWSELEKALRAYQEQKCEDANDLIERVLDDMEEFIEAAESADGAGHFLNRYDGNEIEVSNRTEIFYIYRTN